MQGYLCGCDLWTVGHKVVLEYVPSLPLFPYFFHQSVIPTFPEFFSFFLLCLFVYFFDGLWPLEMISLSPPAPTLILTSLQFCLVFHFRHTPRSREEGWKATVRSTFSVSEIESLRRIHSWLLSLIYKSEVYVIPYVIDKLHLSAVMDTHELVN